MRVCHFRNFQQFPLPIQLLGAQGPAHFDSVYFQPFLLLAFPLTLSTPPLQAARNVDHPQILLAFLASGLWSNSFLFHKCHFFHFYLLTKALFLIDVSSQFPQLCLSTKLGRCSNKVHTLTFEYHLPRTKFAPLLHHLILILVLYAEQIFISCHYRDKKSLGEPFEITELQNER